MTWIKNSLILAGALAVSLVILELAARAFSPNELSDSWLMVDDQGLVLNRPDTIATHYRGKTSATYHINALHMRGDLPMPDVPSILVVGDSFTFGWLVDIEDTLVHQLQKQADQAFGKNSVTFLNSGTGGWGTASYLDFLTRYIDRIQPSAVLLFVNATDFNRSVQSGLYELPSGSQILQRVNNDQLIGATIKQAITKNAIYRWLSGHSHLLNLVKQAILTAGASSDDDVVPAGAEMLVSDKIGPPVESVQLYNIALIKKLKSVIGDQSIPLYVSSQYHWQYTENAYDWLMPVMQQLNIPFLSVQRDLAVATNGEVKGFFIDGDPHPTGAVYKILAEKTWGWLLPQLKEKDIAR